jgi:glycosyltransferase involved in cell wall biosynthesis
MFRADVKTQGLSWVIRACGELYRQGQDFRLVIAGDGPERDKLEKLAAEQVASKVRFVGHIPREKMHEFYSTADLFVFPGIKESLGMVFLEAQSCGLPVVAFDNAGVPEAVQNGRTGLLVPMFDQDKFVDAIRKLLSDKGLRRQMGQAAKSYIQAAHDVTKNYQPLDLVLQKIISDRDITQN